ncbi:MAG: UDP-3-O-(3-hydroxymyristoyl)glucosamine N-acyltransferase [Candidatus Solibacter usitatus]|nr:UDP-3-O-(3-hydroxymyristoyl)glucosamine N-acyltransferase [Candidatus Solibacter usitatus]
MLVREIAGYLEATFEGDGERAIDGVASLEAAGSTQISFVGGRRAQRDAQASAAGCLVVRPDFDNSGGRTVIRRLDPRGSFARIIRLLLPLEEPPPGVHPTAVVGKDCTLGEGVSIGPCCVVGDRVTIGPGSRFHANVTVYSDVTIGARALIHAGAVIGADGFGFVFENGRYVKFPQVGTVAIGDDVEIGANSTIDRAALGITSVGDGAKLDNMVHIGHNCRVGRHVVIAAQTGMAGGTVIEDHAVIGGQVGMGDNVTVKAGAVVGSGAGILSSKVLKGDGEIYWGTPARPLKQYLESLASVSRIPALREEIAELKLKLAELEKKLK